MAEPGSASAYSQYITGQTITNPRWLELGTTGLRQASGFIYEEWLKLLTQYQRGYTLVEMAQNEPIIGGSLRILKLLMRQAGFTVQPASQDNLALQHAKVVSQALFEDMSEPWLVTENNMQSFLDYGWCLLEICFKRRLGSNPGSYIDPLTREEKPLPSSKFNDGLMAWDKWPIRSQDTLYRWKLDSNNTVLGMYQLDPWAHRGVVEIPLDKALLFRNYPWKGGPEGWPFIRQAYRCFSEDTEILTRNGWKMGVELDGTEEVAVLTEHGLLHYECPSAIHRYEHQGDMVHIHGRFTDQLVTENHRLWLRRDHKQEFEFVEATSVPLGAEYKRDAGWEGEERTTYIIPAYEVWQRYRDGKPQLKERRAPVIVSMDAWLQFLGWWLAEGHASTAGQAVVGIAQNEGPKADKIREVLALLPWHVYEHHSGEKKITFEICDRQLWAHLVPLGKAHTKYIPSYVGELSSRQIALLLEVFHLGDGGMSGGQMVGDYGPYEGTPLYFTVSNQMADDLSVLLLKTGWCPQKRWAKGTGHGDGVWCITASKVATRLRAGHISTVAYQGTVWCVTTTQGRVYVRRNGKSCWSGNSWFFKRRIMELLAIGIERDAGGMPMAQVPPEVLNAAAGSDYRQIYDVIRKLVTNLRRDEQEGIVFPLAYDEQGHELYKLGLLQSTGRRQFDVVKVLQYLDAQMAISLLTDVVLLGHEERGTQALATSKTSLLLSGVQSLMHIPADEITRRGLEPLWRLNQWPMETMPTLKPGTIANESPSDIGIFIRDASAGGLTFEDIENGIRQRVGLPPRLTPDDELTSDDLSKLDQARTVQIRKQARLIHLVAAVRHGMHEVERGQRQWEQMHGLVRELEEALAA